MSFENITEIKKIFNSFFKDKSLKSEDLIAFLHSEYEYILQILEDYDEAAEELLVSSPVPGTEIAKLLHANVMLRKYKVPALEEKITQLKNREEKFWNF